MTLAVPATLKIKDVAERTGVAAATIRMWEQRYGFPSPSRTPAGYRLYTEADVEAIRSVLALRHRGLSVVAAIDRVGNTVETSADGSTAAVPAHPSIFAAVTAVDPNAHPRILRRSTLAAISHAIEDEILSRGSRGIVVGAFQRGEFYGRVAHRYERIALTCDVAVVFADFPAVVDKPATPVRVPIAPTDALGNEWTVVVDSPGFSACLMAWERPNQEAGGDRLFESILSLDPRAARRAVMVASQLARRQDGAVADRIDTLVDQRLPEAEPLASTLTPLTNRIVAYLDGETPPTP